MERNNHIAVSEFFYSLQGEGRTMGIPAFFIRLTGCNLMCGGKGVEKDGILRDGATWICDTIKVWMEGNTYYIPDFIKKINEEFDFIKKLNAGAHLIITGGEPLLQQDRIINLLDILQKEYSCVPTVEIETNGTILPKGELNNLISYWNCSPKLSNSGMSAEIALKKDILNWFNKQPQTIFKFVIANKNEFEEILALVQEFRLDRNKIILMPAADSIEMLLLKNKMVAEICIEHNIKMCTRLHVEIWDQLTGV